MPNQSQNCSMIMSDLRLIIWLALLLLLLLVVAVRLLEIDPLHWERRTALSRHTEI